MQLAKSGFPDLCGERGGEEEEKVLIYRSPLPTILSWTRFWYSDFLIMSSNLCLPVHLCIQGGSLAVLLLKLFLYWSAKGERSREIMWLTFHLLRLGMICAQSDQLQYCFKATVRRLLRWQAECVWASSCAVMLFCMDTARLVCNSCNLT